MNLLESNEEYILKCKVEGLRQLAKEIGPVIERVLREEIGRNHEMALIEDLFYDVGRS